jgi:hypothetical protein
MASAALPTGCIRLATKVAPLPTIDPKVGLSSHVPTGSDLGTWIRDIDPCPLATVPAGGWPPVPGPPCPTPRHGWRPAPRRPDLYIDLAGEDIVVAEVKSTRDKARDELRESVERLEGRYISSLFRVVREWNSEAKRTARSITIPFPEGEGEPEAFHTQAASSLFLAYLHDRGHELIEQERADEELWSAFVSWREVVLCLAERFEALEGDDVVEVLGEALPDTRSAARLRPPPERRAPSERLLRLADSISPNAPPRLPRSQTEPTRAG